MSKEVRWLPLETNPELIEQYVKRLGVKENVKCVEILGTDPELLEMVPKPVYAVLLLRPINERSEKVEAEESENLKKKAYQPPKDLFFMKQNIGNACGTIAIVHSLANNPQILSEKADGIFKEFLQKSCSVNPEEKSKILESDMNFSKAHDEACEAGETRCPDRDEDVNLHFVAFVEKSGKLYELDGRKLFPIERGSTSKETLLEDAAAYCKKLMEAETGAQALHFSMMALTG